MIQRYTMLTVADNSGGRFFKCLTLRFLYKSVTAGFIIRGCIRKLRRKRRRFSRVRKGCMYNALIIQSRKALKRLNNKIFISKQNFVIMLGKDNEFLFTRIFHGIPKEARMKKRSKLLIIAPFLY